MTVPSASTSSPEGFLLKLGTDKNFGMVVAAAAPAPAPAPAAPPARRAARLLTAPLREALPSNPSSTSAFLWGVRRGAWDVNDRS